MLFSRENILKLKEEYYKPRDLAENEELENIIDAILKQKAMAMDTGYVADVRVLCIMSIFSPTHLLHIFFFSHTNCCNRLQSITIAFKILNKKMLAQMS